MREKLIKIIKRNTKELLPLSIIILVTLIFLNQILFQNKIFSTPGDIFYFNYPLKNELSKSLKEFKLPMWSNQIGTGHPLFAESQIGTLYLPNTILFGFLPTDFAFNLSYLVIFLTTGFGTYFFLRSINLARFSSLFGAIAFTFSTFFVARIQHFHFIQAVSLMPWEFLLVEKFVTSNKKIFLVLFSVILAEQLFVGFPQAIFYSLLALFAYFIFRIWNREVVIKLKSFGLLALFTGFSFALAAVQLLPLAELLNFSSRSGGLTTDELFRFSGGLKNLAKFVNPYIFGNPAKGTYPAGGDFGFFWENTAYLGLLPFILASFYLTFSVLGKKKNKLALFAGIAVVTTAILAFAHPGPLTPMFQIPPFSFFRIPARLLFITAFFLTVLAAFGLEQISEVRTKFKKIIIFLAVAVLIADLLYHGYYYNTVTEKQNLLKVPATVNFLKTKGDSSKFTSLWPLIPGPVYEEKVWEKQLDNYLANFGLLSPNINLIYDLPSFDEYGSIVTRRRDLVNNIIKSGLKAGNGNEIEISEKSLKLLGVYNVKFIVNSKTLVTEKGEELPRVFSQQFNEFTLIHNIYQNPFFLPKVNIVTNTIPVDNVILLAEKLADESIDYSREAIIEQEIEIKNKIKNKSDVEVIEDNPTKLVVKTVTDGEGLLTIADSNYPGWKATIDGVRSKILPINGNQKAILLPEGKHTIVFNYQPDSFLKGTIISATSWLLLILGLVIYFLRRKLKSGNKELKLL